MPAYGNMEWFSSPHCTTPLTRLLDNNRTTVEKNPETLTPVQRKSLGKHKDNRGGKSKNTQEILDSNIYRYNNNILV